MPHPTSSPTQVPSPETTERGTWSFLVLHSTPSCLKAPGSYLAHPTLVPTLTAQKLPPGDIGPETSAPTSILVTMVLRPHLEALWDLLAASHSLVPGPPSQAPAQAP